METVNFSGKEWRDLCLCNRRINALMAALKTIREAGFLDDTPTEELTKKYDDLNSLIVQIIIIEAAFMGRSYFTLTPDDLETSHP